MVGNLLIFSGFPEVSENFKLFLSSRGKGFICNIKIEDLLLVPCGVCIKFPNFVFCKSFSINLVVVLQGSNWRIM